MNLFKKIASWFRRNDIEASPLVMSNDDLNKEVGLLERPDDKRAKDMYVGIQFKKKF